jgi:cyclase
MTRIANEAVLKTRVIPTLLYREFGLVKGVSFDAWRGIGSAMQAVKVYNLREVDELIFVDITATRDNAPPDYDTIDELADECFMPLTVGGGVRSIEHARKLLEVGADKIAIGSAAAESPQLIDEIAGKFGSQCAVVSIDFRVEGSRAEAFIHCGRTATGKHPVALARDIEARGAGEILLQSIDRDGTMKGYDLEITSAVCEAVSIPVIASGGAGNYEDMARAVIEGGASAVAAASMFHFTQQTPLEAKMHLRDRGIPVRI